MGHPLHCPVPTTDLCGSRRGQEWRTRGQRDNAWLSHPAATLRFGRVLSGCFRRTTNSARPAGCWPTGLLFLEDVETAMRPDARPGWRISELSPDPHLGKSLAPRPGSPGLNWAVRCSAAERVPTTTQHGLPAVPAAQGTSARDVIRKGLTCLHLPCCHSRMPQAEWVSFSSCGGWEGRAQGGAGWVPGGESRRLPWGCRQPALPLSLTEEDERSEVKLLSRIRRFGPHGL